MGPLHFGWFGGLAVRLVYGLLGLGLCVVTSTGVTIWLSRRRDRGRAAPGFERVWSAVAWGQPAVLAITALVSLAGIVVPLAPLWLALTAVLLVMAACWPLPAGKLTRGLRWLLVCALAGLAIFANITLV